MGRDPGQPRNGGPEARRSSQGRQQSPSPTLQRVLARPEKRLAEWHLRHRVETERREQKPESGGAVPKSLIDHVVVLMMENHSYDNYLGTLGVGDGLTKNAEGEWEPGNEELDGTVVRPFRLASTVQHEHVPTQSWRASHIQYDDGKNEGFLKSVEETVPGGDPRVAMGHWTEEDLPFYASLARTFAVADRWHSSLLGPTLPNRRFLVAGTAHGLIDDLTAGTFDLPASGTIFDLLDREGISWTNYHHVAGWRILSQRVFGSRGLRGYRRLRAGLGHVIPQVRSLGTEDLQFTANVYPAGLLRCLGHLRHIQKFFSDVAAGRLAKLSIVDPDFRLWSEENPQDVQIGEGFAAAVINAVMSGPAWDRTLLIWLYDEHGGYFDHVVPPAAVPPDDVKPRSLLQVKPPIRWLLKRFGMWTHLTEIDTDTGHEAYDRLGFRVPAVFVSPYSRPENVSHCVYDHTSILKLLGSLWGLPPLTERVRAANNPLDDPDLFDFRRMAFKTKPALSRPARPWDLKRLAAKSARHGLQSGSAT